jgi:mono/diheme cytochrome c family protein
LLLAAGPSALAAGDPANGAVLAGLASCGACHTADEGAPYAGGHPVETPFGTFYGTNLTPDPEHGIGAWSFEDFERAMRKGKGPDRTYWPSFPYTSFTAMSDADLADLWAYLQSLEPVAEPNRPHDDPAGWKRWAWRRLNFRARDFQPDPTATPEEQRGQYLVEVVGHCGECHSPRSKLGKVQRDQALAGGTEPFNKAPAIDAEALSDWSAGDLDDFFTLGMTPGGDFPGGGMGRIVEEGTSQLSEADRAAMVAWLLR